VRKLVLLVALCMLAVVVLWWLGKFRREVPVASPAHLDSAAVTAPALDSAASLREIDTPDPVPRQAVAAPAKTDLRAGTSETCIVFGRAVDESDHPLAGVVVRLAAYKVWAEGVDIPRLSGKYDMRGWEVMTGEDGRFRFETPKPTAEITALTLEPDPFHDSARMWFGGKNPEAKASLQVGDNDLGAIRLVATGAIRGSVRDEAGAPIADAKLVLGSERSQTLSRDATSDAAGNFVLGHSPAGPMGLNAEAASYLSEFRKPIDVALGRFTDHVDFVLRKAPTLTGTVVDDTGKPIEGVKLWGWPQTSGAGAGGKTLADGSFTIFLPQAEPYTLEATRDGFEPFGVDDRSTHYAPGTRDLRFVMKRLESLTLLVIDDRTSQPITKFGHEVLPNMSDHAPHSSFTDVRNPSPVAHADGRVVISFRPGIDVVDVGAPGYESERFDPEPGIPPDGVLVVKLVPTASVFGVVRLGGVPTGGIALRLEAGHLEPADSGVSPSATKHFAPERDGASLATSGADGSFRFDRTARGMYRLIARAGSGEAASVNAFSVAASASIDLGTIDLVAGAAVRGVVLVPPGRRAAGLTVSADQEHFGEKQVTDAEGRFRFDGMIAGEHQLFLLDAPGSIGEVPPVDLQLAAGEVREIQIDARDYGTCQIDLTIWIGEHVASNALVELTRDRKLGRAIRLGTTDKEGHIVSPAPLAKAVGLRVLTSDRLWLEHPTARFDLTLDARIVETVRFEVASLVLELPQAVTMPAKSSLRLELTPSAGGRPQTRYINLVNGATTDARTSATQGGHRLHFDDLLAGDWQLVFDIADAADPMEMVQIDARTQQSRRKKVYTATSAVRLVTGQAATVELH
jgi:hypothetical protein